MRNVVEKIGIWKKKFSLISFDNQKCSNQRKSTHSIENEKKKPKKSVLSLS